MSHDIGRREALGAMSALALSLGCDAPERSAMPSPIKLPTLYLPHGGGPCFYMDWTMGPSDTWDGMATWLRGVGETLPETPRALLVVSAHWEQPVATVLDAARPPLLYDYSGFPPHTYELEWSAPGSPEVAGRVRALLGQANIASASESSRGLDHGVFVPLKLTYPQADVPTVQLSLVRGLDPAQHLAIGRALAPLREEGVFIVGSGMSYHHMRHFMTSAAREDSRAFDGWLRETASAPDRSARLERWAEAPSARASHPREEHLLPLMVCAGAAEGETGSVDFSDVVMNARVSALRFG